MLYRVLMYVYSHKNMIQYIYGNEEEATKKMRNLNSNRGQKEYGLRKLKKKKVNKYNVPF